jgi:hypothetical protein
MGKRAVNPNARTMTARSLSCVRLVSGWGKERLSRSANHNGRTGYWRRWQTSQSVPNSPGHMHGRFLIIDMYF